MDICYIATQSLAQALGKQTGIVIDIGTDFVHVVPTVEVRRGGCVCAVESHMTATHVMLRQMFSIAHASMYLPVGGQHVTHALNKSLCSGGYALGH